jgi:hypothetical protein
LILLQTRLFSRWSLPLKLSFYSISYHVQIFIGALPAIFVRGKGCICGLAEVLRPQITKRLGPQIANPQSFTFAESPQI